MQLVVKKTSCLKFHGSSSLYSGLICQLYTEHLNSPETSLKKSHIITPLVNYAALAKLFWYLCLRCIQVIKLVRYGEFSYFQFALYLYLETCSMH